MILGRCLVPCAFPRESSCRTGKLRPEVLAPAHPPRGGPKPGVPAAGRREWHSGPSLLCLVPSGCRSGFFGPGCALRCSCGGGADCDAVSGQCHCVDGYVGPMCQQGESGSGERGTTLLAGPKVTTPARRPCYLQASDGLSGNLPALGPWGRTRPWASRQCPADSRPRQRLGWAQTAEGGDPTGRAG